MHKLNTLSYKSAVIYVVNKSVGLKKDFWLFIGSVSTYMVLVGKDR